MTDIDIILSRLAPPLRVEAFNHICAGKEDYSAMIVRDDEPGSASILAQQMQDQTAHDICDLVNSARDTIAKLRAEVEELREALRPFVDLRHQPESVKVISKTLDDMAPVSVTVTKRQMRDAASLIYGTEARAAKGDNQ